MGFFNCRFLSCATPNTFLFLFSFKLFIIFFEIFINIYLFINNPFDIYQRFEFLNFLSYLCKSYNFYLLFCDIAKSFNFK